MVAHGQRRTFVGVLASLLSMIATSVAVAAVPVHVVKTDLRPLIRAAFQSHVQFAVSVPHSVSSATDGFWTTAGGVATWRYAVQVPTAVSISFHAFRSVLPESAVLVVQGARTTSSYHGSDLHRGELWSRIYPGDGLQFTLTVAVADRNDVVFNITSLQAGYRSLGIGVPDHPYYRELRRAQTGASDNSSCVTNYACEVTANNTPPGAATVALVVGNLYECSGVLINDVPGSNTPYVLTARHCETGSLGGGNPGAASTLTVYWDATTTPCGATLGSIYDSSVRTQTGAQTLVEQEDAWLVKLDESPLVPDAQFAGFDASGGPIDGGYTIHHAEGNDKQYVQWFGQSAAVQMSDVLGSSYVSNFWETVNQLGNVGPGASGSGLFDQNDRLVGLLTLGRQTSDPSGYGSCPIPNPPAPDGTNGTADFTSLAAVWTSTADSSSSTGNATLKSVLDPANTGTLVTASEVSLAITFAPQTTDVFNVGTPAGVQWSAVNATTCAASGGTAGDGWTGTLPNVGSQSVVESTPGTITYTLTCQFPGGRTGSAFISLQWVVQATVQATVQINAPFALWAGAPATVSWNSTVSPCALNGGELTLTNLPASGSETTTQASAGDVDYTATCGLPGDSDSTSTEVQYVTPSVIFAANGTDRLLGQDFFLEWITEANSCTPSGGAPNDGWATTALHWDGDAAEFSPHVSAAGTYTYTLTCSSASITVQKSVTVTFENNAPYVTASLSPASVIFSDSPADYSTVTWNSNLSNCALASTPNLPFWSAPLPPFDSNTPFGTTPLPQGTATMAPAKPGTYVLTVTCSDSALNGLRVSSTPMTLTVGPTPAPTAAISLNPSTVLPGQSFTVSWTSANTSDCTQSGGIPGGAWAEPGGAASQAPAGSVTEQAVAGNFTFALTCDSIDPSQPPATTQANLDIQALAATLSPANTSVTVGQSFTLTWSSTAATSCTASGGGADGTSWSGSVNTSGTLTQTATTTGTYTYKLACDASNEQVMQQAVVTVSSPSGDSSGGHGGGGAIGLLELAVLATLGAARWCSEISMAMRERRFRQDDRRNARHPDH